MTIRCRIKSQRVKMCPAAKRIRRELAVNMYNEGHLSAVAVAKYCGFMRYGSVLKHVQHLKGVRL